MTESNGLRMKDFSDWLKVGVVLITVIVGYVKLTDTVNQHSQQIESLRQQIASQEAGRQEEQKRLYQKLGAIEFYLCSKDSNHCDPNK